MLVRGRVIDRGAHYGVVLWHIGDYGYQYFDEHFKNSWKQILRFSFYQNAKSR